MGSEGASDGPAGRDGPVGRLVADRYRLAGPIGAGAMGAVWLARDELLDVDVAVKEIRPPLLLSELRDVDTFDGVLTGDGEAAGRTGPEATDATRAWLMRALHEARNAARLRSNPHVVTVHDAVVDDGAPWIVMEAVAARSLQEAVEDAGPRPLAEVARIGLAVLDALVAASSLGVVHRDVKPSNILLAFDGRVLLTDFGIAAADTDPTLTYTMDGGELPSGTPAYMAPERLQGGPATLVADLFGLGATLFFAADGIAPFHRDSVVSSLNAVLHADPEPVHDFGPLAPVIAGLLAKDPAARLRADGAAALFTRALRVLAEPSSVPSSYPSPASEVAGVRFSAAAVALPAGRPSVPSSRRRPRGPVRLPAAGLPAARRPAARRPGRAVPSAPPETLPVLLGDTDPDGWQAPVDADGSASQSRGLARLRLSGRAPVTRAVVAVVVLLAVAGLTAWGIGAARAGTGGAARVSGPASRASGPAGSGPPGSEAGSEAGRVPAGLLGGWRGTVRQDDLSFGGTLDIRGGGLGEMIGVFRSSAGCVANLRLQQADAATITVDEVLTQATAFCVADRLWLTLNGDGTVRYYEPATDAGPTAQATLTRTTQPPPTFAAPTVVIQLGG